MSFIRILMCWVAWFISLNLAAQQSFLVMEYNVENLFDCRHDSLKNDLEFMPDSPRGWNYGKFRKKVENIARVILSASRDIVEKFAGQVPSEHKQLKSLAGVGQKTANVVYAVAFGGDAIAVDTHVFRVSNRLGLAHADTPQKTELQLREAIPQADWSKAHHWLIYHGRQVCHSQKPDCINCTLNPLCPYFASTRGDNTKR